MCKALGALPRAIRAPLVVIRPFRCVLELIPRAVALVFLLVAAAPHANACQTPAQAQPTGTTDPFGGSATGTGLQPASTPMHGFNRQAGAWSWMVHGFGNVGYQYDPTPRGNDELMTTSMLMTSARRAVGPGWLEVRAMASLEPTMGARGYPLLLQTGETADGVNPLVDRQHPHDVLMELSASYRLEVEPGAWAFLYAAPVGEPAVGPPAFMHRQSGADNPVAPLSHHFLDATHIAYGVLTAGLYVDDSFQLEVSAFNGREPDQHRWDVEGPEINSASIRITLTPGQDWAVQASFASLNEPEQLHPVLDVYRATFSAMYVRALSGGSLQTTVAVGRNIRRRTTMSLGEAKRRLSAPLLNHYVTVAELPPGADDSWLLLFPEKVQAAILLESALQWGTTTGFARFEWADKDELFPPSDRRHSESFGAAKLNVGLLQDFPLWGSLRWGVGVSGSIHLVDEELDQVYGRRPSSFMLFTRIAL